MKAYFLLEHSDLKLEKKVQQQIWVKAKINFLKKDSLNRPAKRGWRDSDDTYLYF